MKTQLNTQLDTSALINKPLVLFFIFLLFCKLLLSCKTSRNKLSSLSGEKRDKNDPCSFVVDSVFTRLIASHFVNFMKTLVFGACM